MTLVIKFKKWPRSDSNRQPTSYEPAALTIELQGRKLLLTSIDNVRNMRALDLNISGSLNELVRRRSTAIYLL